MDVGTVLLDSVPNALHSYAFLQFRCRNETELRMRSLIETAYDFLSAISPGRSLALADCLHRPVATVSIYVRIRLRFVPWQVSSL